MKKRFLALSLCFYLTFQIGFVGYGQAVEAGEFIGELTTTFSSAGSALLTLMALLGVTPEVATVAAIGGVTAMGAYTVSKFEEFARQELGYTDDTIPNFLEDIKDGVVSTVSDGFSAFKSWIHSLSSSDATANPNLLPAFTRSYSTIDGVNLWEFECSSDYYFFTNNRHHFFISFSPFTFTQYYSGSYAGSFNSSSASNVTIGDYYYVDQNFYSTPPKDTNAIFTNASGIDTLINSLVDSGFFDNSNPVEFVFSPGLSDYIGAGGTVGDLTLEDINDLPLSGTDSISINLENINEKLGSIDSVLDRIIAGEIPLTKVRDTAGVVPVTKEDVLTEEGTVPKDEYKGNEEDLPPKVVVPSYDPDDYKVTGLQNVFPFCMPFDLIDFIGVLKADPETPVFVINCSFLGKKFEDLTFTIDLKPFDPLAKICRYSELFLFCVGLIIVTRNIIKG